MSSGKQDRRKFMKNGALLASLALGSRRALAGQSTTKSEKELPTPGPAYVVPPYGERSRFVSSHRAGEFAPLQDFMGIITPAALHYTVDHGSPIPDIDPAEHRLLIHGLVDRPLMRGKQLPSPGRQAASRDGSANPWKDKLQRMDRRALVVAIERGRRASRRNVARCRGS